MQNHLADYQDSDLMGDGYLSIKHKQLASQKPEQTKLTFEQIENMHFTDLQGDGNDDFRPSDIFTDTDVIQIHSEVDQTIEHNKLRSRMGKQEDTQKRFLANSSMK